MITRSMSLLDCESQKCETNMRDSDLRVRRSWKGRSPVQWHTDQSPEPQPPGTTFICMLESPSAAGGDTLVGSSVQAYKSLSPRFRKRLEGLTAIHTNNDGVSQELKNNGDNAVMRRKELVQEHPVVIVHPVTKEKALCKSNHPVELKASH